MLVALFIIVDDDLEHPIYAEPQPDDVDSDIWEKVCEVVQEVMEGDLRSEGSTVVDGKVLAWRAMLRNGMTFVAVVDGGVTSGTVEKYLKALQRRYFDEVDDVRRPERAGVADVVVEVIPPWEDED